MPWPKSKHGSTGQGHGGPARGGPAKGAHPALGSAGDGWGGPARGESQTKGRVAEFHAMSNDPDVKAKAAERIETLKDHLYGLATSAERQETQLAATVAYLNRVEGMPVQRQVVATVADPDSMTDAELAAIAAGGRTGAAEAPADTEQSGGVVH